MVEKLDKEIALFAHRLLQVSLGEVMLELDEAVTGGWAYGDVEDEEQAI